MSVESNSMQFKTLAGIQKACDGLNASSKVLKAKELIAPKLLTTKESLIMLNKGNVMSNASQLSSAATKDVVVLASLDDVVPSARASKVHKMLPLVLAKYFPSVPVSKILLNTPLYQLPSQPLKEMKSANSVTTKEKTTTKSPAKKRKVADTVIPDTLFGKKFKKTPVAAPAASNRRHCTCGECYSESDDEQRPQSQVVQISQENVNTLVSLGFARSESVEALALSRNNLASAAHLLLEGQMPPGVSVQEAIPS